MDMFHIDSHLHDSEDARKRYVMQAVALESLRGFLFEIFGKQVESGPGSPEQADTPFAVFEAQWKIKEPFGESSWTDPQSESDGMLPNWLLAIRRQFLEDGDPHNLALPCLEVLRGMITRDPRLAGASYKEDPYAGMTLLHQACAAGDVELVKLLTESKHAFEHLGPQGLESNMTGCFLGNVPQFFIEFMDLSTPTARQKGQTPLEVAMVSCAEDHASIKIVRLLINAGAKLVFREGNEPGGKILYTVLHLIARSSWQHDNLMTHPHDISDKHCVELLHLLISPTSDLHGKVDPDVKNPNGYTCLQVAAMMGNMSFFITTLEIRQLEIWQWGEKREAAFALKDIESTTEHHHDQRVNALDLAVIYKRFNLVTLGLSAAIINDKWARFARLCYGCSVMFQIVVAVLTAIVCLDDTKGYHAIRWYSKMAVVILTLLFIGAKIFTCYICARSQPFFGHLSWRPTSHKLDIWSLLVVRNAVQVLIMCALSVTAPWTTPDAFHAAHYAFWWHVVASLWWLLLIHFSLRYFELFEITGQLAATVPQILAKDVFPFGIFFLVVFICSGISLRSSVAGSHAKDDDSAGTFVRTLWTLEEAIHGPDVAWRPMVEEHPLLTAIVFIIFIWVMLALVSLLTAMFSNRFNELGAHADELFLFRRAEWVVTVEKLIPTWVYNYHDLHLGIPLGKSPIQRRGKQHTLQRKTSGLPSASSISRAISTGSQLAGSDDGDETIPLSQRNALDFTPRKTPRQRWFLWKGGTEPNFTYWKEPIVHKNYFTV